MPMIYPDALPLKLRILRTLTETFTTITPENGFVCDLSDFDPGDGVMTKRVYRGRAWFGDNDPETMLSILEGTTPADEVAEPPVNAVVSEYWWDLLIQGWTPDDKESPTDPAYLLLRDVRKRLALEKTRRIGSTRYILGYPEEQIVDLHFGPGVVRPADDVSDRAWFWLTLSLRIIDDAQNPEA
jgi:hypothetical protein